MATQYSFERHEKKYLITDSQYNYIIREIKAHMISDEYGKYSISNIYYDTPDWALIRASIEKPDYKEKLRVRSYGVPEDNDKVFVEIKKKCCGVVYKRRINMKAAQVSEYLAGNNNFSPGNQIGREIEWFQKKYNSEPRVFIGYSRQAFAGIEDPQLRITFDSDLKWRTEELDLRHGNYGFPIMDNNQILMEIKIPGAAPLWLSHMLSIAGAFPTSYSKYGDCYKKHLINSTSYLKEEFYIA